MSKKENKRYRDADRKTAPKRGGKNRRDYGDTYTYEPKRKSAAGGRRAAAAGRRPAAGKKPAQRSNWKNMMLKRSILLFSFSAMKKTMAANI